MKRHIRIQASTIIHTTEADTLVHCGMKCTGFLDCLGVNFESGTGVCELADRKFLDNMDIVEANQSWEAAYKIY